MASSEAFLQQNFSEADEERAMRSIVVSNLPQTNDKDLIIHFQKSANGGKDVDAVFFPYPDDSSAAVVTFDDPSTVESVLEHKQTFAGRALIVQRYPVAQQQPPFEVFSTVKARLNTEVIDCKPQAAERLLAALKTKIPGIKWEQRSDSRVFIKGSYDDIKKCHSFLQEYLQDHHQVDEEGTDEQMEEITVSEQGAHSNHISIDQNPSYESPMLEDQGTHRVRHVQHKVYTTTPLVCQFVSTVPKYQRQLNIVMQEFLVDIQRQKGNSEVAVIPKGSCTQEKFDQACEEVIHAFQEAAQLTTHCDIVTIEEGAGITSKGIAQEVMKTSPVLAVEGDFPGAIVVYGKEDDVEKVKRELRSSGLKYSGRKKRSSPCQEQNMDRNPIVKTEDGFMSGQAFNAGSEASSSRAVGDKPHHAQVKFLTKKGIGITVHQGDITDEQVDVIVYSTDENLTPSLRLANSLSKNAEHILFKELNDQYLQRKNGYKSGDYVLTGPTGLTCVNIAHAVTPRVGVKNKDECKKLLQQVCVRILKRTEKEHLTSIVFPAIGTGLNGIPLGLCATALISGVEEYMRGVNQKSGSAVTDIRFVDSNDKAVEALKEELIKRYKSCMVTSPEEKVKSFDASGRERSPGRHDDKRGATGKGGKPKLDEKGDDTCPICLEVMQRPRKLDMCGHKFCDHCISKAFQLRKTCPVCGIAYGVHQGNMPKGSMSSRPTSHRLPGYERSNAIEIIYNFPDGTQGKEHPNPGRRYQGAYRVAYLPDNPEGREVLGLLKKAFDARLTFTIGTSVTTGQADVVTWNDIHHKTNTYGGATGFGYPDPTYLSRVKEELAAKGIR